MVSAFGDVFFKRRGSSWKEEGRIRQFEQAQIWVPFLLCWAVDRGLGIERVLYCDGVINEAFGVMSHGQQPCRESHG